MHGRSHTFSQQGGSRAPLAVYQSKRTRMTHLRALSALLLLIAVTGYAMEPSIDWHKITIDPRTTYIVILSFLAVLGMVGVMWRKR